MSSNLPRILDRYHSAGRRACMARAHDDPQALAQALTWLERWGARVLVTEGVRVTRVALPCRYRAKRAADTISSAEAVNQITNQLLLRAGELVTPELALELARGIVAGLTGTVIR